MIDREGGVLIEIEERVREKKREEAKILSQQGITEKSFQMAVMERMADRKLSFVLALYQVLDEFLEREIKIFNILLACKKRCSLCCYQMITCTEMEIDEIIKFLKAQPREIRHPIIKDVRKVAVKWRNYFEKNKTVLERNSFQSMKDWRGRPCPFLNKKNGSCNIYPVRIIDCRTATSLISCTFGMETRLLCELDWPGPATQRFHCGSWAIRMILDEQKKKIGFTAVTPLHHWFLLKEPFKRKELSD